MARLFRRYDPRPVPPPAPEPEPPAPARPDRPEGCLVWIHCETSADAGALQALVQELSRLRGEPVHGVVTAGDAAPGASPAGPSGWLFAPPERGTRSAERFLGHWRPDVGIVLGPLEHPELFAQARKRGIPLYLAAAKRGDLTSLGRGAVAPTAAFVRQFSMVLAPSAAEAQVFHRLNLDEPRILIAGPLGDTALALPCNATELEDLRQTLSGRPVWLASEVTSDEIGAIEAAQRRTIRAAHRLLLIVAPRERESGPAVAAALEAQGWRTALRSSGDIPDDSVQVFVADVEDEMGLWYRLAPIAFMGGTLDAKAPSADPFDAAALGSAVVHGPQVSHHPARYQRLAEAGATLAVDTAADLGEAIFGLLSPDKAATLAHAGWTVVTESAPVVERLARQIDAALDKRGTP